MNSYALSEFFNGVLHACLKQCNNISHKTFKKINKK